MDCNFEWQLDGTFRCARCGHVQGRPTRRNCRPASNRSHGALPPGPHGAGWHLKRLLHKIGFRGKQTCKCGSRAAIMDQFGPAWCRANIEELLDWLKEEADERGVLFVRPFARLIVLKAIRNAEKELVGVVFPLSGVLPS